MGASEISAGKAFLKLLVDDSEFAKGLDAGLKKMEGFGKSAIKIGASIGAAGAAITGPLIGAVAVFSNVGSELGEMAERTGVSVEKLSALKFAANQSGTSLEAVEKALRFMAKSGQDINSFDAVAKKIAAIEDPSKRTQAALEAFGRSGAELVPLLQNLDETEKKAGALGLVMSTLSAKHAKDLQDAFGVVKLQAVAFASAIGDALAPAITKLLEIISNNLPAVIEFAKTHQGLTIAAAAAGVALTGIGAVITITGTVAITAAAGVRTLSSALLLLAKNPWAILATVALVALSAVLTPLIDRWISSAAATDTAAESTNKNTTALKTQNDAIDDGNKKLDKRAQAIANLTIADRRWLALSDERAAKNAQALQALDLQIAAVDERIKQIHENGDFETFALREAEARRRQLQQQRDELSGEAPKKREEAQKQAADAAAKSRDELQRQQDQAKAAREKHLADLTRTRESIINQFDSFSRPTQSTFNGRLANQVFGTSLADTRLERQLKLDADQLKELREIKAELKKPRGLVAGRG